MTSLLCFQLVQHLESVDKILGEVRETINMLDLCPFWQPKAYRIGLNEWILKEVNASLKEGKGP